MTDLQLADLAQTLFSPVTLLLYTAAMVAYLYAMAFSRVDRDGAPVVAGRRALTGATALGVLAITAHAAHLVTWSLAAGRFPLGNMFEFSSVAAFVAAVGGLAVVQWKMRRPEVMGFVLLGVLLTLGMALLVYTEPGPLMPILDSWWRVIHVSTIVLAFGIFTIGFVFTLLYLLRDTAERRVAEAITARASGSTVGAAFDATATRRGPEDDELLDAVPERTSPEAEDDDHDDEAAYGVALRRAVAQRFSVGGHVVHAPLRIAAWVAVGAGAFSLVFQRVSATVAMPLVAIVAVALAWWFLPHLPAATTLDSLAYRTTAFAFPIWTFGVIAGAIWAEQSWGRYWGWDPKETGSFLTWVSYAGYLHARATRGMRGRGAAWVGLGSYGVLLITYYVVNLIVTGLHSYAGLD